MTLSDYTRREDEREVRDALARYTALSKVRVLRHMRLKLAGLIATPEHGFSLGICSIVGGSGKTLADWLLQDMFMQWPEFSGRLAYPVGSPDGNFSFVDIYHSTYNLWDKGTEYGAARWRLVQHCLDYTNREITRLENAKEVA